MKDANGTLLLILVAALLAPLVRAATSVALTLGNPPGRRMLVVGFSWNDYMAVLLAAVAHVRDRGGDPRTFFGKLHGQEKNLTTAAVARMNLFLHGIEDFVIERGDTLRNPLFTDTSGALKTFDVVLANPPFSLEQWGRELLPRLRGMFALAQPTLRLCAPIVNVSVAKTNLTGAVTAGGTTSYQITVTNYGPGSADGSVLTDDPGNGLECTQVQCAGTAGGATCPAVGASPGELAIANLLEPGDGVVLPSLPAPSTVTFTLRCDVDATGD